MLNCIVKKNLDGAHNSAINAQAQIDIVFNSIFINFIDRTKSIWTIDKIFSKKSQNEMKKKVEPERNVHEL